MDTNLFRIFLLTPKNPLYDEILIWIDDKEEARKVTDGFFNGKVPHSLYSDASTICDEITPEIRISSCPPQGQCLHFLFRGKNCFLAKCFPEKWNKFSE